MRRIITFLIACLLVLTSLTGCDKKENDTNIQTNMKNSKDSAQSNTKAEKKDNIADTSAKMGRYMEKTVKLPDLKENERVLKILENFDHRIEMYTSVKNKYYCYTMNEDMTWKSSAPEWLNDGKLKVRGVEFDSIYLGEDGNYYAAYAVYDKDARSHIIKSTDGGKTAREIKIPYLNMEQKKADYKFYPIIRDIKVLKNGNLLLLELQSDNSLLMFSPKGEKLEKISFLGDDVSVPYKVYGNNIIMASEDKRNIVFYNTDSKKVERTVEYEVKSNSRSFAIKEDGTVLMSDFSGIHRLQKNGTLWETPVDGVLNSMSMPTLYLNELFVTEGEEEQYYVSYQSDDSYKLLQYKFDKNVSAVPAYEITVYSLQENKTIRQAVALFQSENADVKVNYVVAMGEEGGTVSDYIRALNTELLAGNGADVLLLDGLPVNSYLQKGVLADYSDIIKPLEESGKLLSNITSCYHKEDKIFQLPLRFGVPAVIGKKDALTSIKNMDTIIRYIQKNKEKPYSSSITYRLMLQSYLALYSKNLFHNGLLDKSQLVIFLENMKMLADNTKTVEQDKDFEGENTKSDFISSEELFRGRLLGLVNDKYSCDMMQITGIGSLVIPEALIQKKNLGITSINQLFLPIGMIGLNNASKETDIAKKFISFLYSDQVQDANVYDGFPVNLSALKKWVEEEQQGTFGAGDHDGNHIWGEWPKKEERVSFLKIIQELTTPVEIDQVVDSILIEEALSFLTGKVSAQQAAAAADSKINTYLSE